MAKTLANLRVGVRVYLDEANQADFLDTEVDRSINYSYQDLISEVMEVYEQYYLTTTPIAIATIADQQEYSLDSTVIKVNRVEINYKPSDSNSKPMRAKALTLEELPRYLADPDVGGSALFNSGYYVIGKQSAQKIGFVPIPTETASGAVNVWGIVAPSDMSSSSDNVDIPYADRFSHLIELKAASDLLRKGQQEEGVAKQYLMEYLGGTTRMKTFLKERLSDGAQVIVDVMMEDIAFDSPL